MLLCAVLGVLVGIIGTVLFNTHFSRVGFGLYLEAGDEDVHMSAGEPVSMCFYVAEDTTIKKGSDGMVPLVLICESDQRGG